MVDRPLGPQSQGAVHRKLHAVHRHGSQRERGFCAIRWPRSDPSSDQTAENAPDCVKDLNCMIRWPELHQNPDPMADIRSNFDKD